MIRSHCFLALLLGVASAGADEPPKLTTRCQTVAETGCPACTGYLAEVEVSLGGVTRHGRIIVTREGGVHLEHLDEEARAWVQAVLRQEPSAADGWDDRARRAGPVRYVWGRLGEHHVLSEVHAPAASLKVSRHQLFSAR